MRQPHPDALTRLHTATAPVPTNFPAVPTNAAPPANLDEKPLQYSYETLNEYSFQKLAQALIVAEHPGTQCLPIGQPDGGRDAYRYHLSPDKSAFVVFQVKYSRNPESRSERDVIESTIATESAKVASLVERGATHYYLITNVRGTAHLDSGSIDKANAALADALNIPAEVWWRDDLDSHLDNHHNIKWSYPQILPATAVLSLLLRDTDHSNKHSTRAVTSYMGVQCQHDREIKFKQVGLRRSLTDLFVDLPIGLKRQRTDRDRTPQTTKPEVADELEAHLAKLNIDSFHSDDDATSDPSRLAAAIFLQTPLVQGVSRFVLEGAPGQGKSTVTQFVCQVNRLRLLPNRPQLARIANYSQNAPVRTPFRLDLRHYATWLNDRNPFPSQPQLPAAFSGNQSLESFIAMQVSSTAETQPISSDQLLQFLERSHSIIVLDGFDEVADISTRTRMVEAICAASARFDAHGCSVLIVVTSRPAVFANSPGFPESDWIHLELGDLHLPNILSYKDKWADAQDLDPEDRTMVSATLDAKLQQPHLRDLARNPMQLSILLHLIHVQGPALPEKRTTLYGEYMKLFLNREAAKSDVVRDHRELMLSVHGLLGWHLHTQAEQGTAPGSVTKAELQSVVRGYLRSKGHPTNLLDSLITGAIERVGALVSRVEGTFEFEVQPLREYFAALHLYQTARYSPPGKPVKGTKPDRFAALARSAYWTNVTRFFSGFFDVGELGTLVDGLIQLDDEPCHRLMSQPRRLAIMLLSDHVFLQAPRTVTRLIDHVALEPAFFRLTASEMPFSTHDMALPAAAGRDRMCELCSDKLLTTNDPERLRTLRTIMSFNAEPSTLKEFWRDHVKRHPASSHPLAEAFDFRILHSLSQPEIEAATGDLETRVYWLLRAGKNDAIFRDSALYKIACEAFCESRIAYFHRRAFAENPTPLEVLSILLNIHALPQILLATPDTRALASLARFSAFDGPELLRNLEQSVESIGRGPVAQFARSVFTRMSTSNRDWQTTLAPWSALVDEGLKLALGTFLFEQISGIATSVRLEKETGDWSGDGFAPTVGLAGRLHFARSKHDDEAWWRNELARMPPGQEVLALAVLLSWGRGDMLQALRPVIERTINGLQESPWGRLEWLMRCISGARRAVVAELAESEVLETVRSPRLFLALISRVRGDGARRRLVREAFGDYRGSDHLIIQTAADSELVPAQGDGGQVDWEYVGRLSKLGRRAGIPYLFSVHWPEHNWRIPEEFAAKVLESGDEHSAQFVAICERSYSMNVSERTDLISAVAEKDGWFDADQSEED